MVAEIKYSMMPVKARNDTVQKRRFGMLRPRAMPGMPCVDVFRPNSRRMERRRVDFGLDLKRTAGLGRIVETCLSAPYGISKWIEFLRRPNSVAAVDIKVMRYVIHVLLILDQ